MAFSNPVASSDLFDPHLLSRIQHLALTVPKTQSGGRLAQQRTNARGQGIEFADYKPYSPGDDIRNVDWMGYQRDGRLFVKVFEEEQAMPVYVLVDTSASMYCEAEPRINSALQLAMAFAGISLSQHDSVRLYQLQQTCVPLAESISGAGRLRSVAQHLSPLQTATQSRDTSLARAVKSFTQLPLRRGLMIVLSDFFTEEQDSQLFQALSLSRHHGLLVQLVQPFDADPRLHPSFSGDMRLADAETAVSVNVRLSDSVIREYMAAYNQFNQGLEAYAKQRQFGLLRVNCADDAVTQLTNWFQQQGQRLWAK